MAEPSKPSSGQTILQKIVQQRHLDVAEAKRRVSFDEIRQQAEKSPYALVSFPDRLKQGHWTSVLAEVKRASPSKGDIAPGINAADQGLRYAKAGAAAISCLTEPTWFKGTLDDMKSIREAIETLPNRPALLRKDFIVDEYQIYEARVYGADTLLLIVAALTQEELEKFLNLSRLLDMEPLVEVNTPDEMARALQVGSKIIGINNRNLHDFSVDLDTTRRLTQGIDVPSDVTFVALSGISSRKDVEGFEQIGTRAVLVGESLMRADDPAAKIRELQGKTTPIVKICGIKDVTTALATAEAGADMIGLVFAASKRKVSSEQAKEIVGAVRAKFPPLSSDASLFAKGDSSSSTSEVLQEHARSLKQVAETRRPLFVGVFADQTPEEVNKLAQEVDLDFIQLSGHEGFEALDTYVRPVLKAVHVAAGQSGADVISAIPFSAAVGVLLDTFDPAAKGGTGRAFNWDVGRIVNESIPIFLAGGLNPDNIGAAVAEVRPLGVDVSSGVEGADGAKDISKIQLFIQRAKQ